MPIMDENIPPVGAVANWFGSARMMGARVAQLMGKQDMIVVPFAGGMTELPYFQCRSILVNDLHRAVINLAQIMSDPIDGPQLYRRLRRTLFHADQLRESQAYCEDVSAAMEPAQTMFTPSKPKLVDTVEWAYHYFITSWMARAGSSGTSREFKSGMSVRYEASGGDSAKRFQSAISGIQIWRRTLRKCVFTTLDAFEFFKKVRDQAGTGIYSDCPFDVAGEKYEHKFLVSDHEKLKNSLSEFKHSKVVIRYYDTDLIRGLYPDGEWLWHTFPGRTQANKEAKEVLIENNVAQ